MTKIDQALKYKVCLHAQRDNMWSNFWAGVLRLLVAGACGLGAQIAPSTLSGIVASILLNLAAITALLLAIKRFVSAKFWWVELRSHIPRLDDSRLNETIRFSIFSLIFELVILAIIIAGLNVLWQSDDRVALNLVISAFLVVIALAVIMVIPNAIISLHERWQQFKMTLFW